MTLCKQAHDSRIYEQAVAMRYAMNADEKQFAEFEQAFCPREKAPPADDSKKIAEGREKLRRIFGG